MLISDLERSIKNITEAQLVALRSLPIADIHPKTKKSRIADHYHAKREGPFRVKLRPSAPLGAASGMRR